MHVRIWGASRSGSTIFENFLSSTMGILALGEIKNIISRGVKKNELCSCGQSFSECVFWRSKHHLIDGSSTNNLYNSFESFIDSSKLPTYYFKNGRNKADLNFFIVRDLSDVMKSYRKNVKRTESSEIDSFMRKRSHFFTFFYYFCVNIFCIVLIPKKNSYLILYNDFVRWNEGIIVNKALSHQISGNPSRLQGLQVIKNHSNSKSKYSITEKTFKSLSKLMMLRQVNSNEELLDILSKR